MSTKKAIFLNEQDEAVLKSMVQDFRSRRRNTPAKSEREFEYLTPEVYIALVPDAGIPGRNITDHRPGNASCKIYKITDSGAGIAYNGVNNTGTYTLVPVSNKTQTVFNLNVFMLFGGGSYTGTGTSHQLVFVPVIRDKFGAWLVDTLNLPKLAKYATVAANFASSPTGAIHLFTGSIIGASTTDTHIAIGTAPGPTLAGHPNVDLDGSGWMWLDYSPDGYAYVIQAEHFANYISGVTTGSLSSGGSVSVTQNRYWDGLNPVVTTVYDPYSMFGPYPVASGSAFVALRNTTTAQYEFLTIIC